MAINYFGAVRLTSLLLPRFLEQGHGHVTFSSTMSTQLPIPLFSAYLASKSALESYARSLMAELGHDGITTTIVYFPMVRTEMSGATAIYSAMPMLTAEVAGTLDRQGSRRSADACHEPAGRRQPAGHVGASGRPLQAVRTDVPAHGRRVGPSIPVVTDRLTGRCRRPRRPTSWSRAS